MTKFKRLMALAAVSMLGIQLMGVGTSFAVNNDPSECDFNDDNLEITIDGKDVELWVDADGLMNCDDGSGGQADTQAADTIKDITVEVDDEESDGTFTLYLAEEKTGSHDLAVWPELDSFDIDITTQFLVDGGSLSTSSSNKMSVVFGASTFKANGVSGTYSALSVDITGSDNKDSLDASKGTVKFFIDGGAGDDTIKGGTKNDSLDGGDDDDSIYGNAGNDAIDCGAADTYDAGWGGAGDDQIDNCNIVAPGTGDDDVDSSATKVNYSDVTGGIEWTNVGGDLATGGAAGDDTFDSPSDLKSLTASAGNDVVVDDALGVISAGAGNDLVKTGFAADVTEYDPSVAHDAGTFDPDSTDYVPGYPPECDYLRDGETPNSYCFVSDGAGTTVLGGAGNDVIASMTVTAEQEFYGGSGSDILRGKAGDDLLAGGPGSDQAWGGTGTDICGGEVTNRCEYLKK